MLSQPLMKHFVRAEVAEPPKKLAHRGNPCNTQHRALPSTSRVAAYVGTVKTAALVCYPWLPCVTMSAAAVPMDPDSADVGDAMRETAFSLPTGRTMADAQEVLRDIITFRPPAAAASCRTRSETRRIISKYTAVLGLGDALGLDAPSGCGDAGKAAVPSAASPLDASTHVRAVAGAGSGTGAGAGAGTARPAGSAGGRLPVVHVAGTKGKGSTCSFVESILRAHGYRTGACVRRWLWPVACGCGLCRFDVEHNSMEL